jgi:Mg2+ and Co2+ transporter CorA
VPFEHHVEGFVVVLAAMAVVLVGLVAYFRRRGWL